MMDGEKQSGGSRAGRGREGGREDRHHCTCAFFATSHSAKSVLYRERMTMRYRVESGAAYADCEADLREGGGMMG